MRLHTNVLTWKDILSATAKIPGVYANYSEHGSRTHARAFEVRLEGNGYARNTGTSGADGYETGATWDEWGAFMAALYTIDPDAVWGSVKHPTYVDREDFLYRTDWRFDPWGRLPQDTHKRHVWRFDGIPREQSCSRCEAVRRF